MNGHDNVGTIKKTSALQDHRFYRIIDENTTTVTEIGKKPKIRFGKSSTVEKISVVQELISK
jgi:hypothetical protein